MENVNVRNLPIAGKIQHGMQIVMGNSKKVKELGYFIANVNNNVMDYLGNRFAERYPKDTKIKVRIFDENPLVIRQVRYNQGGTACYCMKDETEARRKASNKWEKIHCSEKCEHRIIPEGKKKPACNREAKLFFMIPEISDDSIWFMRITGKKSIDRVEAYLEYLKQMGNSLIGDYTLYLTQEQQTNKDGESFNNFILGIYKDNFNSNNEIPIKEEVNSKVEKTANSSKQEVQKTVEQKETIKPSEIIEDKVEKKPAEVKEKAKETKKKKTTTIKSVTEESVDNTKKYYALIGTTKTQIMNKNELKEYVVGNFVDYEDKPVDVIVPHEYAEELSKCELGTMVELDLKKAGDKTFTNSLKYIQKYIKNVAA